MKNCILVAIVMFSSLSHAADTKMKLNFKDVELTNLIEQYAATSGQKFIVDSSVRGKITLFNPTEVSLPEAFNQISEALSINGYAVIKNGDTMTIKPARSVQRDNIETSLTLPAAQPQRMASWIVNLKNVPASDLMNQLRVLSSSYGEVSVYKKNNQLIISDFTSNLQRVAELIKQVDIPQSPSVKKIVDQAQKDSDSKQLKMMAHGRRDKGEQPPPARPEKTE